MWRIARQGQVTGANSLGSSSLTRGESSSTRSPTRSQSKTASVQPDQPTTKSTARSGSFAKRATAGHGLTAEAKPEHHIHLPTGLPALQSIDIAVRHPEGLAAMQDAIA